MQYILASIFKRFWWIWDSKLGTMCLQDAPRRLNLAPKTAQESPKTGQEPPKSCSRSFWSIKPGFWIILEMIFEHLTNIFEGFWKAFQTTCCLYRWGYMDLHTSELQAKISLKSSRTSLVVCIMHIYIYIYIYM